MKIRWATIALWMAAAAAAVGCGDDNVTTGAWAEFRAEFTFSGTSFSITQSVNPDERPEMADVKDDVTCGGLDFASSSLSLIDFDGAEGKPFTLKASLIDGGESLPLFDWSGTIEAGAGEVSFGSSSTSLKQAAVTRLSEIMVRSDKSYEIKYDFEAADDPNFVKILVVQRVRVATEKGTCPPTQL